MKKQSSIKRQVMLRFALFALFMSALFSLVNFLFMYNVEDMFFERTVNDEVEYILNYYEEHQSFPQTRQPFISLYMTAQELPNDIREQHLEEPGRKEFYGEENRHYHLHRVQQEPGFFVLAEVSDYLVVRPIKKNSLIFLIILSTGMLLLALLIAFSLARRTVKPLTQLANLVEASDPDHLPKQFAQNFPNNEIGSLATALEDALSRIKSFIEREQHFTRDVSHELRTPIAVIKGATELLSERITEDQQPLLKRTQSAILQMEHTVNTLLTLAREDSKQEELKAVPVLPIVENCVIQHHNLLNSQSVQLNIQVQSADRVVTRASVLQILLSNLISNAFQYTHEGQITIGYDDNSIAISDSGSGIQEDIKDSVLESQVKGEQSKGFGIGLSIVKRLCDRYNIELNVKSTTEGTSIKLTF
ncbi:HAMP domain-containing histidine kinase [Alteromonadaceae bacterium M269]|nr:HAMP domain-containing histidine kinase [Alteromonadaceae bacterium M269]